MTIQPNHSNQPNHSSRRGLLALALLGCLGLASASTHAQTYYERCKQAWNDSHAATDTYDCDWQWTKEDGLDSTGQLICEVYVKCSKCQHQSMRSSHVYCVGPGWGRSNCTSRAQGWFRGYESEMKKVYPFCHAVSNHGNSGSDVWLRPEGWTGS